MHTIHHSNIRVLFSLFLMHKWAPNTRHYRQLHGQTKQPDTGLPAGPPGPHLHSQGRDWLPKYRPVSHMTSENHMTSECHRIVGGHLHAIDQSHRYGSQDNSGRFIDWYVYYTPRNKLRRKLCFWPVRQSVSPVFLLRATPLKPLNRISWNFVVMMDLMCRCAYPKEILI